ncbi:hypothetical protein D3C75_1158670 [compost metagenome]
MAKVELNVIVLAAAAFVEQFPRPERISGVRQTGWRRKVGGAPFLVQRHAAGDLAQFLELGDPKVFIQVQVTGITLRGAYVGAEEHQTRTVR